MRFASLNNSNASDYAIAGKEGAKGVRDNFAIMRQTGPRYDELSERAMRTRSAEKVAAIQAQARVGEAGVRAMGDVARSGIEAKLRTGLGEMKGEQTRMAGKLAAAKSVLAGGAVALFGREDKTDNSWKDKYHQQEMDAYKKRIAELENGGNDVTYPTPPEARERPTMSNFQTANGSGGSGGSTSTSSTSSGNSDNLTQNFSGGTLDTESVNAIRQTANYLQLDPYEFGALIEMESSHRPNVWGGAGGKYRGLIQFGPGARSEVGLPDRDMTIAEQMPYVQKYFDQRGFKPGQHNIMHAYRTVLVGNPHQSGTDSWGTNSDGAAKQMMPGGDLYNIARKRYGAL